MKQKPRENTQKSINKAKEKSTLDNIDDKSLEAKCMPLGPGPVYSCELYKLVYYIYGWWALLSKIFLKEKKVYHGKIGSLRHNIGLT